MKTLIHTNNWFSTRRDVEAGTYYLSPSKQICEYNTRIDVIVSG